jgi:lauroyl/myristoyl acyltransferase
MNFNIQVSKPIKFDQNDNILTITENLNRELEKMILLNPSKWIWTHNRWK